MKLDNVHNILSSLFDTQQMLKNNGACAARRKARASDNWFNKVKTNETEISDSFSLT